MEIKFIKKYVLENSNSTGSVTEDCRRYLAKAGFADDDIDMFAENVAGALDDYAGHFEEVEAAYKLGGISGTAGESGSGGDLGPDGVSEE